MAPDNDPLSLLPAPSIWPGEFEAARCPDTAFAAAWDLIPPTFRVAIKNAIALAAFHFAEAPTHEMRAQCDFSRGFSEKMHEEPVPWAAIVFDAQFNAPARLASSCLLAALCGVPQICAICPGGEPLPQTLVALELCGIEDLFCPEGKAWTDALAQLPPEGRLTIFGKPEISHSCKDLPGVITHIEDRRPTLFLPDPRNFDLDVLALAQGVSAEELMAPKGAQIDGLYIDRPLAKSALMTPPEIGELSTTEKPAFPQARLTLGPGLEAFWLLENYGPEFFRSRKLSFFWLPASQNPLT